MSAHTLIASRDPVGGDGLVHDLARGLASKGEDVALFLVDNGVFAARRGAAGSLLADLLAAGVRVHADELACRERGITGDRVADGVDVTGLETLIDHLAAGRKTAWF